MRVVFTALMGRYEPLTEQPVAEQSDVPFICFTDDPDLRSDTWDVRLVEPCLALDPVRSARALKITGHDDLAAFDETLWIDARIRLTADPAEILQSWLKDSDLAVARHSYRVDVVTEFEEVLLGGFDDSSRLFEQLTHYSTLAPDLLEDPAPWTAILARRRSDQVERAMAEWFLHVARYSRRDQLSFVHAISGHDLAPRLVEIDNFRSPIHEWLGTEGRSKRPSLLRVSEALRPPTARIGELRRQLERTTAEMSRVVAAREQRITTLENEVARLHRRLQRKQGRLNQMRERLEGLDG